MIAELIIYMYLQRREQEQDCRTGPVHLPTCGLKPQQSTAPSISCPSTFHLDAFNLLPRALKHRRVNVQLALSLSFKFSLSIFFFRSCTETQPGDTAGFWLSKGDLKTLTLGSKFQVEILPTIVGKDAKQNGSFTRPSSRRSEIRWR